MLEIHYSLWPPGSLWIQVANFLVLLFLLNMVLYKPIRKVLSQRKAEMDWFQSMIGDFETKSAKHEKDLEENAIGARREGHKEKEVLRIEGLEEEKGLLHEATSSAEERIGKAKDEIRQKAVDVRKSLEGEAALFSKELAEKILGRSI
jgi:F-type H+-transporting ATPase subunit b